MSTKAKTIGYWVATGIVALGMGVGGVFDILSPPEVVAEMKHLGYPAVVATLLGVWKVLAAVALLAPGFPLVKEWAYAGIVFDLTGAAASHISVGDDAGKVITPLVFLAIAAASWALRPPSRTLRGRAGAVGAAAAAGATEAKVGAPQAA
jgi:DoxX-like protein